jgi:hypothetical protein
VTHNRLYVTDGSGDAGFAWIHSDKLPLPASGATDYALIIGMTTTLDFPNQLHVDVPATRSTSRTTTPPWSSTRRARSPWPARTTTASGGTDLNLVRQVQVVDEPSTWPDSTHVYAFTGAHALSGSVSPSYTFKHDDDAKLLRRPLKPRLHRIGTVAVRGRNSVSSTSC